MLWKVLVIWYYSVDLFSFPASSTGSTEVRGDEQAAKKDDDFDLFGSDSEEEVAILINK